MIGVLSHLSKCSEWSENLSHHVWLEFVAEYVGDCPPEKVACPFVEFVGCVESVIGIAPVLGVKVRINQINGLLFPIFNHEPMLEVNLTSHHVWDS